MNNKEKKQKAIEICREYLKKYGQLPMLAEVAVKLGVSVQEAGELSTMIDGVQDFKGKKTFPLGKIKP